MFDRHPKKVAEPPRDRHKDLDRYKDLLQMAMADGKVAGSEMAKLAEARAKYRIPLDVHEELLQRMGGGREGGGALGAATYRASDTDVWEVPAGSEKPMLRGSPEALSAQGGQAQGGQWGLGGVDSVDMSEAGRGLDWEVEERAHAADRAWKAKADKEAGGYHDFTHSFPSRPLGFSLMAADDKRGAKVNVVKHANLDKHIRSSDVILSINGEDVTGCEAINEVAETIVRSKPPIKIRFRRQQPSHAL
jgi:hypothetical protein